ncbi:MAG: 4-hydroxy-3-methylbut-2-enyl diphosphate reductase [Planctomycetes bacterium]|nr:4-hydroxy-3-methylbut-2-enyl diphosphate reductase [Planctomycetota bacterium]
MQVKLAKTAGFCMGVRRALDRVLEAAAEPGGRLSTFGPLIHNSQVIGLLEDKQVSVVKRPEDVGPGDRVLIRAHGVPPETRKALRERGATICDATCPHVARAQGLVKRAASKGSDVVIVGDKGHAEVDGLLGFAGGRGHVIEGVEDVDRLPPMDRVAVVAQTTQSEELYRAVAARLRARYPACEIFQTICGSTSNRQRETIELANQVDVMVVVGGRHSANTVRLAQIAGETGKPTIHIESADELREEDLRPYAVAGVTAGASTPNWLIEEVVERLEGFHTLRTHRLVAAALGGFHLFVRAGCLVALGAGGLAYGASRMLDRPFRLLHFALPAAYVFSMLNLNDFAESRRGEIVDPARAALYRRHGRAIAILSAALAAASIGLAARLGIEAILVLFLSALFGVLYTIPLFPAGARIRYRRLKDIPGSKNISFAAAVGVVTVVLPLLDRRSPPVQTPGLAIAVALLFASVLALTRSVVLDVKDIQSDMLAGRETIPVLIGKDATKALLAALLACTAASIAAAWAFRLVPPHALWQIATLGFTAGFLVLYHLRIVVYGIVLHLCLDTSFALAGLVALLAEQ